MAFAARELSVLAYANGFTLWHYRTEGDDLLSSGYFDSAQELLRTGDQIISNTGRHALPGIVNLVVTRVDAAGVSVGHVSQSLHAGNGTLSGASRHCGHELL